VNRERAEEWRQPETAAAFVLIWKLGCSKALNREVSPRNREGRKEPVLKPTSAEIEEIAGPFSWDKTVVD